MTQLLDGLGRSDFFDVLGRLNGPGVDYKRWDIRYINQRYRHIVEPIKHELVGATVLDLGSHDGRWPYAFAAAGAKVTGIEGRREMIAEFARFPDPKLKRRVKLLEGDFVTVMDRLIAKGRRYDVVTCLGVYYHTMHHYRMLLQMAAFQPRLIIVDSVFHAGDEAIISVGRERTRHRLSSIPQQAGQAWVSVGRPSRSAFELMAETVGYRAEWVTWNVPEEERRPVKIYLEPNEDNLQRFTCLLRPS